MKTLEIVEHLFNKTPKILIYIISFYVQKSHYSYKKNLHNSDCSEYFSDRMRGLLFCNLFSLHSVPSKHVFLLKCSLGRGGHIWTECNCFWFAITKSEDVNSIFLTPDKQSMKTRLVAAVAIQVETNYAFPFNQPDRIRESHEIFRILLWVNMSSSFYEYKC